MSSRTDSPESDSISHLTAGIRSFAKARDWGQFHTPKNLAMAIAVEAAELMEPLMWMTEGEAGGVTDDGSVVEALEDELADVGIYLLRLADVLGVDLGKAVVAKMARNEARFPVDRVRGRAGSDS